MGEVRFSPPIVRFEDAAGRELIRLRPHRMWPAVHRSASHLIWGRPFPGAAVVAASRRSCVTAAPGSG